MSAKSSSPNKKKTNKRRRISKHVIEAKKKAAALKAEENGGQTSSENVVADGTPTTKSNSGSEKEHASQAIAYLNAYIASRNESSDEKVNWKFSKNTQTWLIKHMYDADRVSKSTFTLLLEYLRGLQGKTKSRVLEEASERVLRYKEHEKQLEGQASRHNVDDDDEEKARRKVYKRARQIVQLLQ